MLTQSGNHKSRTREVPCFIVTSVELIFCWNRFSIPYVTLPILCNYGKTRLEKLSWQWENLISKIAADYGVDQSGGLNIIWVCFHCLYVSHVKLLPLTKNTPVGLFEKPRVLMHSVANELLYCALQMYHYQVMDLNAVEQHFFSENTNRLILYSCSAILFKCQYEKLLFLST